MTQFNELPQQLQEQIKQISESDKYNLNPQTLYQNIYNSTGSYSKLSEIFEVPLKLIKEIKELSQW